MRSTRRKSWFHPRFDVLEHRYAPAIFNVTTPLDVVDAGDGLVSLREALNDANANADADVILLPAGTYKIALAGTGDNGNARGDFDIRNPVTIRGIDAAATIIDADSLDRVFHVISSASFAVKFAKLTIQNGFVGDVGGGIYVDDNSSAPVSLTVKKSVITENFGNNRGGGISSDEGPVTIVDCTISNNLSNSTGSGINIDGESPSTITRCTITGNSGTSEGGGVATTDSDSLLTINDSLISDNSSGGGGGGGIDATGDLVLNNTVVRNNVSGPVGGGGLSAEGNVTIDQCSFLGNTSFDMGGGIFGDSGSSITISNSQIVDNRSFFESSSSPGHGGGIATHGFLNLSQSTVAGNVAGNDGGGIFSDGTRVVIDNCTISDNRSIEGVGGGLALRTTGTGASGSTLTNTTVSGNFNLSDGGGIFVHTGALTLTNCTVSGNQGTDGGGVSAVDSDLALINSAVTGNTAHGDGGGVSADGGSLTLSDSTISDNIASLDGGGLATGGAQATLTRSTVSGNQCGGFGGGVSANTGNLTVIDSTISGNISAGDAGGIRADVELLTITGSTISGNTADGDGAGIAVKSFVDAAVFTNVTISGNIAQGDGGGLHIDLGVAAEIVDLLHVTIADNRAVDGGGIFQQSGTVNVKNSLIGRNKVFAGGVGRDLNGAFVSQGHNLIARADGGTGFVNDTNDDQVGSIATPIRPRIFALADNGGPTKTHALRSTSTAIDAGNNTGAPATDQRGLARIADGDGDTVATVDIGAFEL